MSHRRASKRRQVGEGPSEPSFDRQRFITKDAEDYHNNTILRRGIVKERGLTGHEDIMHQRHWEEFMAKPGAGNKTLVREFYANLKFTNYHYDTVTIRGTDVDFSANAINRLFGTPTPDEHNEFHEFAREPPSLDTISERLCVGPPEWVRNVNNEPVGILRSSLTNETWDWLRFVNARLYPSSHLTEVSRDRAILLYAILSGVPLDIGRYIHYAIRRSAQGGLSMSLYFPSLITALCERALLVNQPGDELIQPDSTINEENRAPPPPPAQRRQRRPRGLTVEERLNHIDERIHRLEVTGQLHWDALYDYLQVPQDRRPNVPFADPDDPAHVDPDEGH